MKILLIEDDHGISNALKQALATSYTIDCASTGEAGLGKASIYDYALIVLDLNLPDIFGLTVCQQLRQNGFKGPILILTGETKVLSKITLLDAGADDYLTKPFSLGELKARMRTLLRRATNDQPIKQVLSAEDLTLNISTHVVERAGTVITLRRKEFLLLECLLQNADSVVSRGTLTSHAWPENDSPWTNTVDVHIKYLRDKIDRPFSSSLIQTVHGLGYKIETSRLRSELT